MKLTISRSQQSKHNGEDNAWPRPNLSIMAKIMPGLGLHLPLDNAFSKRNLRI